MASPINTVVPTSRRASAVRVEQRFQPQTGAGAGVLPQRIALVGAGNTGVSYPLTPLSVTSAGQVAEQYGDGSLLHLAASRLFPVNRDVLVAQR